MKFSAQRETLLALLQHVIGAIERKQTKPILANILIELTSDQVTLTATDSEVEMKASASVETIEEGSTTVPARKIFDVCRNLPEGISVSLIKENDRILLKAGRSRFTLTALPAKDFPKNKEPKNTQDIKITAGDLLSCIKNTAFSMAQQDVRFYLNGLLLEIGADRLTCVATDGHRLAYSNCHTDVDPDTPVRAIIPRKSVIEIQRILGQADHEQDVYLKLTTQQLQAKIGSVQITTKLIDGRFPDYNRVIPLDGNKEIIINCQSLKQSLTRTSVLSNEKLRGVRVNLENNLLVITSNNPDQEEAIDELEIQYEGDSTEIGFNVTYLLDVLNTIEDDNARILVRDGNSSALITPENQSNGESKYVVMPMRL